MLNCKRVVELFRELSRVPRGSGNPQGISTYLGEFGRKLGVEVWQDEWCNVVLRKAASPGWEDVPGLIIQSHMDMVCVKGEGVAHDFERDPIEVVEEAGWLHSNGTSLGADDGLGMALSLAILEDDSILHPMLECVYTSDEETNMEGARNLDKSILRGAYFLNLDQEEDTAITVSSAGIADTRTSFPLDTLQETVFLPDDYVVMELTLEGLQGGHSGIDISLLRCNAVQALLEAIERVRREWPGQCFVHAVEAGSHMNAIPKSAKASLLLPRVAVEALQPVLDELWEAVQERWQEPEFRLSREIVLTNEKSMKCYTEKGWRTVSRFVSESPNGVWKMDPEIADLVETSANLARLVEEDGNLTIWVSVRSSQNEELDRLVRKMQELADAHGGQMKLCFLEYGWPRQETSRFVPFLLDCYRPVFGKDPVVTGIHAGLECGAFARVLPGVELVSMGPTLYHPHTIGERANLRSLELFTEFLQKVVENFAVLREEA